MSRLLSRPLLLVLLIVVLLMVLLGLLLFLAVRGPFPKTEGTISLPGLEGKVEVYRDPMGIPHIYAGSAHDLFMAQGFVHAQDRFWQMEFSRRIGSGRLAEVLGESALESDRFIRTVGWHRVAAQELALLDKESLGILEAYSAGVNGYIESHKGSPGLEFTILGLTGTKADPEPWTPLNTLTWAKVMAYRLSGNMTDELLRAHIAARLGPDAVVELVPPYDPTAPVIVPHPVSEAALSSVPDLAYGFAKTLGIGSNSWVVSGRRTESGKPLLANDPHLGIQMPSVWYEIGLHCEPVSVECPYNVAGSSFPGAPGVIIGHNDHIAWGLTNLGPDVQDLFIERVNPENPNQYEFQGKWLEMEIIREEIRVAGEEEPVVVFARLTQHGPIINDVAGGEEEAWYYGWQPLALSWTALQPGSLFRSILLLDKAQGWNDFRQALRYWDSPSQNVVYADVDGNIGYQAPGRIPVRASGDGTVPVPGWSGKYEWQDTIPFEELPWAFNPPEGYVVTANHAVVSADYPYLITQDWGSPERAERIISLLEVEPSLSIADMQAMQADSVPLWAQDVLPYVVGLAPSSRRMTDAIELLRSWDGRATRDSAGAALFEAFRLRLIDVTFGDELGEQLLEKARPSLNQALPLILPIPSSRWFDNVATTELETRDSTINRALEEAVEELSDRLGSNMAKWRWGDLHQATFRNQSLGESGISLVESVFNRGPFEVDGTLSTINNTAYDPGVPFAVDTVPSYRQIIDLADFSQSLSIHTTGQSGHPYHPHYDDMIEMWRNFEYHPALWERSTIEGTAAAHLTLEP